MRPAALLPLTATFLLTAAPALADAPNSAPRLEYLPGPGTDACPDAAGFRIVVASHMNGVDPFDDKGAKRLKVQITKAADHFDGLITTYDAKGAFIGERRIADHATCDILAHALAVSISLILPRPRPAQPRGPAPAPYGPTTPTGPQLGALPGSLAPDASSIGPADPFTRIRPQLAAGFLVPIGTTPDPTIGLAAAVGFRWRFAALHLEGRADLPRSTADASTGAHAASSTYVGSLVPCAHLSWFLGCGIATIGATRITAEENMVPQSLWGARVEIGARLGLQVPLYGPLSAQLSSDLVFPLVRYGISLAGRPMWEPPIVAVLPGLRLVATL